MLDDDLDARVADIIVANLVDSYGHGPCDSSTLKGKQQENSMLGVSKLHGEGVFQVFKIRCGVMLVEFWMRCLEIQLL